MKMSSVVTSSDPMSIEIPKKPPHKSASEHRRATKPIMEKRRRARINHSLNELKSLILDALNKDPSRHSKLEKADILEMTVRYLQNMQRQQTVAAITSDPSVINKFRAGFNECATEVTRYVNRVDNVDPSVKQRLVSHLTSCVSTMNNATAASVNSHFAAAANIAFPGMIPPPGSPQSSNNGPLQVQIPYGANLSNGFGSASSAKSAVNLTTTNSGTPSSSNDINNNNQITSSTNPCSPQQQSKLLTTPPSSASSTLFTFTFPPVSSSHLSLNHHHSLISPVTPVTPTTPSSNRGLSININYSNQRQYQQHQSELNSSWNHVVPDSPPPGPGSISPGSIRSISPVGSESHDTEMSSSEVFYQHHHHRQQPKAEQSSGSDDGSVWRPW